MKKILRGTGAFLSLLAICIANLGSALLGGEVKLPEILKKC